MKTLLPLLLVTSSSGFLITEAEPGLVLVSPGQRVTLFCAVDDDYEWCKWWSPGGEFCDFEWKRSAGNITIQECGLGERVAFHGKYDDKECGITFTAKEGDTGMWKCEIEEYVTWRSRGAGRVQTAQMNVTVQVPTTAAPETTSTVVETVATTEGKKAPASTSTESSTEVLSETTANEDNETLSDTLVPEAVPQVNENQIAKAGSSSSVVIGVFIVIIVIVVAVSGAFYYRARKKSSAASIVYDKEARTNSDQANMVRNSNSNITFHSGNAESSNLHEYYPPNLTYSTVTPESQA